MSAERLVRLSVAIDRNLKLPDLLVAGDEEVICVLRDTKRKKRIPFRVLYEHSPTFWANSRDSWTYYVQEKWLSLSVGEDIEYLHLDDADIQPDEDVATDLPANFGPAFYRIAGLSQSERDRMLSERRERLAALVSAPVSASAALSTIAESSDTAGMINKATINDAMLLDNDAAKVLTQNVVNHTEGIIKSTSDLLFSKAIFSNALFDQLHTVSNGTVVAHMTRTLVKAMHVLNHYNLQVSLHNVVGKIRVRFNRNYRAMYQKLLSHLHEDQVTLERVFLGGMKRVDQADLNKFSQGFLMHDIGKMEDIEYHEGKANYDRDRVVQHVKQGFQLIRNKTNYPVEVGLIAGYHHEYYNDEAGYGFYRDIVGTHRRRHPKHTVDYCITYDLDDIHECRAWAYFPAKLLEIVDVFDALTDRNRQYRSPLTPEEALTKMREEFIEKNLRLDPILFDIFVDSRRNEES